MTPRKIALLLGLAVAALGGAVLAGWALDSATLKSAFTGMVTMKPNTAGCLLLCGTALALLTGKRLAKPFGVSAIAMAAVVVAVGLLTLGEYLCGWDLGIDHWLFRDVSNAVGTSQPGRMSPATAFCLVLIGSALLTSSPRIPARLRLPMLAAFGAAVILVGSLALIGYVSEASFHIRWWNYTGMAFHAAAAFVLLGCGLLALAKSEGGLMWALDRTVTAGFIIGVAVMLVATGVSYNFTNRLQQTAMWVSHTQEVLKEIQEVMSGMAELESGQRGHIISGDERLLEHRKQTETAVNQGMGNLRRLTEDNPRQQRRLDQLEPLLGRRMDFGNQTIATRKQQGFSAAGEMFAAGTDTKLSDEIHKMLNGMRNEEYALLDERRTASSTASTATFLLLPLGSFLSLTILSAALLFLNAGVAERNNAALALREKDAQFHAADRRLAEIVQGMTEACFALDTEWRFTFVNDRGEALLRHHREHMLGRTIWEVFQRLVGTPMEANYRRAMTERVPVTFEAFSPIAERWLDIRLFPTTEGLAAFLLDIHARKLGEEALRVSEEQFRTMANSIPQLAWMAHADGFIFWYNQRWHDYTGTTPEQMEGWGWQSVHDPDVLPKVLEKWRGAITTGQPFEMEFPLRGADGRFRVFLTRGQPLKDSQGRVVQWLGTNTDVDELKRMELSLRDTQARLNSTLAAGSIGTWTWDIVNDRLVADEFTARMFSIEVAAAAKGLPAQEYLEVILEEDRPGVAAALERAIQSCGHYDIEYRVRQIDGDPRWLQARGRVECDGAGNALNFHGAVMDITERKRADAALREIEKEKQSAFEASRLKSEFLANMSHELRTPLNGILGFTEFLVDEKPGPLNPKQKEYLTDVHNSAQHLLQLINDVLDLSRVEAGKVELHPETFSPAKAIEEVCAVVKGAAHKKRVNVTLTVAPELGGVTLDQQKFKQICYNLVANAVKFTDSGGSVEISALAHGSDRIEIRVKDTGIGIRKEDMPRLFREFEQLETGSTRRFEGTGLGLALTKKLVELQGGSIGVESEYGKGSTFTVVLPLTSQEITI